jgi:DNA modification methylase
MKLINNDCIAAMKEMPDNSVDSIVTDPPYELGFMGKSWDASGIAFNIQVWQEALRVLKPGGHLIAFSGSRTYHRMAVAIEDAGFEIRDQIMWVYGSGFPKSHNISKAIDKAAGAERNRDLKWVAIASGSGNYGGGAKGREMAMVADDVAITDAAKQWQGWGTALKPAHEPMVLARKPIVGTVANNVLTYGVGGLNIDASRVGYQEGEVDFTKQQNQTATAIVKMGGAKPGDSIQMFKENGRFPANFIHDGSDEVVALFPESKGMQTQRSGKNVKVYTGNSLLHSKTEFPEIRLGHNDSGSAARFFYCAKASKSDRNEGLDGFEAVRVHDGRAEGNPGGSNPRNRTNDAKVNHHPTVKPTDLMRYLCRLITPPAGIVLDPFMGSGSTGKAAILEGFDFIGIDMTLEYVEIAKARIEWAVQKLEGMLL